MKNKIVLLAFFIVSGCSLAPDNQFHLSGLAKTDSNGYFTTDKKYESGDFTSKMSFVLNADGNYELKYFMNEGTNDLNYDGITNEAMVFYFGYKGTYTCSPSDYTLSLKTKYVYDTPGLGEPCQWISLEGGSYLNTIVYTAYVGENEIYFNNDFLHKTGDSSYFSMRTLSYNSGVKVEVKNYYIFDFDQKTMDFRSEAKYYYSGTVFGGSRYEYNYEITGIYPEDAEWKKGNVLTVNMLCYGYSDGSTYDKSWSNYTNQETENYTVNLTFANMGDYVVKNPKFYN